MPQVLIHASLVSSSSLSVLNIDHCLTLHPFSLNSLLFWHDLIHVIGVEIMATVWFMSKLGLQDTQRELRHPELDTRNITLTMSNISKLSTFHIGTIHFLGNRNTISTPYLPAPSLAGWNSRFCRGITCPAYSAACTAELTPFIDWLPRSAHNSILYALMYPKLYCKFCCNYFAPWIDTACNMGKQASKHRSCRSTALSSTSVTEACQRNNQDIL